MDANDLCTKFTGAENSNMGFGLILKHRTGVNANFKKFQITPKSFRWRNKLRIYKYQIFSPAK